MSTGGRTDLARLLRFLSRGVADCDVAAMDGRVVLAGREGGAFAMALVELEGAARRGLVLRKRNAVGLSETGRALLRRMQASSEPHQEQHRDIETRRLPAEAGPAGMVAVNTSESPLSALARRRNREGDPFLSQDEFDAGERLRADYTRGQLLARTGIDWQAAGAATPRSGIANAIADLTDAALAARQRVEHAIEAVGPELAGILIDVCCFLKGLEQVEMERAWPVRSAKVVLKQALAALARHYRPARDRPARPAILHWGAEGFRPSIR